MADLNRDELQRLARLGAKARLEELRREEAAIRRAFPDLFGRRGAAAARSSSSSNGRRRRRGKLSAAGRAAISAAQKRRWAAVRAKKS